MDLGIKHIDPDQHAVDNDVDGIDLKDHSLQRDWSDLEERQAKRKSVIPPNTPTCFENHGLHAGGSRRDPAPADRLDRILGQLLARQVTNDAASPGWI
jgi:hypothetical protein